MYRMSRDLRTGLSRCTASQQWWIQGGQGGHAPQPNQDTFFAECTRNAIMSLKPLQTIRTAKYNQF